MIYIVCPNEPFGRSYVVKELHGNSLDREIRYVTTPEQCEGITLVVGDKVHKISDVYNPMPFKLYFAWEQVERRSGLPVSNKPLE